MSRVSVSSGEGPNSRKLYPVISPAFRRLDPPVIVIGMHRSGTSLVSGMLSLMGVYMDPAMQALLSEQPGRRPSDELRRLGYGEASAFRRVNDSLLLCAGTDWRNVGPFLVDSASPRFRRWCSFLMQAASFTSLRGDYLDHAPDGVRAWGWKDPRNSVTLPYWLRLFPDARVLHVRRDPHKVVDSLIRREVVFSEAAPPACRTGLVTRLGRVFRDPAYATAALRRRLGQIPVSPACPEMFDRAYLYALADLYVRECEAAAERTENYLEVRYEDVVTRPAAIALRLAAFAGVHPSEAEVEHAVEFVERPRAVPAGRTAGGNLHRHPQAIHGRHRERTIIELRSSAQ